MNDGIGIGIGIGIEPKALHWLCGCLIDVSFRFPARFLFA